MTRTFLTAAIVALTGTTAFALTEVDTNGDGMASYDELLAAVPELTEDAFTLIDANGDGMVDAEEYAAAQEAGMIPTGG